jgi:hypothetical protein
MSVNVTLTIAVPLDNVTAIKKGNTKLAAEAANLVSAKDVTAAVKAMPEPFTLYFHDSSRNVTLSFEVNEDILITDFVDGAKRHFGDGAAHLFEQIIRGGSGKRVTFGSVSEDVILKRVGGRAANVYVDWFDGQGR